jgi:hypothetical protein
MPGPGPDRPFIAEEFVGRDEFLAALFKVARHETPKRILVLLGPFGIGKSWLLKKMQAERVAAGIDGVLVDFAVPPLGKVDWGYLDVVEAVRDQLGGAAFGPLGELIEAVRKEGAGLGLADPFATQLGGAAAAPAAGGGDTFDVGAGDIGAEAQVAVGNNITMAQGDVNYTVVNQLVGRNDQVVQQHYQARITAAFEQALHQATAEKSVTFVFDGWLKATTPTRDWLCRTLLAWIRDKGLEGAAAVLADDAAVPELQQRHPLVHSMDVAVFNEAEVVAYWVDKRGLSAEKTSWVQQACLGHPLTLAMIADLHEMTGGL